MSGLGLPHAPRYIAGMYRVKVEDDEIVVTNPTNDWFVSYRRTLGIKGLRVTDVVTDRKAGVSERARFLGEAFSKATGRARKLGWVEWCSG
jgi:hypothetical protein